MGKNQKKLTANDKRRIGWILEHIDCKQQFLQSVVKSLILALDNGDLEQVRKNLDSWEASAEIDSIPDAKKRIWKTFKAYKKDKNISLGWKKFKRELGIHESQ